VGLALLVGQIHRNDGVLPLRKLGQYFRTYPAQQHRLKTRPQRIQVARAHHLALAISEGAVPRRQAPLWL
jgi:hypothetical protein